MMEPTLRFSVSLLLSTFYIPIRSHRFLSFFLFKYSTSPLLSLKKYFLTIAFQCLRSFLLPAVLVPDLIPEGESYVLDDLHLSDRCLLTSRIIYVEQIIYEIFWLWKESRFYSLFRRLLAASVTFLFYPGYFRFLFSFLVCLVIITKKSKGKGIKVLF